MAIVQCENNHYYDNSKNSECPYCAKVKTGLDTCEINEQLTSYMDDGFQLQEEQLTEAYGDFVDECDKTIGIFIDETQNELTVGWLVCMKGLEKGKSYILHSGRNFVGRAFDMDIVLTDDMGITRDKHFSIVYDPKSISFYFVSGNGQTYINGKPGIDECKLNENDILEVGNSEYMFIPFCKKGRVW